VPALNMIVWVQAWAEVFVRLGQPSWTALAMAVPGLNLLLLARVAGAGPSRIATATALVLVSLAGARAAQARGRQARVAREVRRLQGPGLEARRAAAAALAGGPASAAAVAPLSAALRDTDVEVRREAARALARLGARGSAAGPELRRVLRPESEAAVRAEVARALLALGGAAAAPKGPLVAGLLDAARGSGERGMPDVDIVDALAEQGHAAVPQVVAALREPTRACAGTRGRALHLGRQAAGHAAAVRQAMTTPSGSCATRPAARWRSGGPDDVPSLIRRWRSSVRRAPRGTAPARQGLDAGPPCRRSRRAARRGLGGADGSRARAVEDGARRPPRCRTSCRCSAATPTRRCGRRRRGRWARSTCRPPPPRRCARAVGSRRPGAARPPLLAARSGRPQSPPRLTGASAAGPGAAVTLPWPTPIRGEERHYAYLRSAVVDGDLRFENEYRRGDPDFVTSNFRRRWPPWRRCRCRLRAQPVPGAAVLWAPAFRRCTR
jgi:hypothetical protein